MPLSIFGFPWQHSFRFRAFTFWSCGPCWHSCTNMFFARCWHSPSSENAKNSNMQLVSFMIRGHYINNLGPSVLFIGNEKDVQGWGIAHVRITKCILSGVQAFRSSFYRCRLYIFWSRRRQVLRATLWFSRLNFIELRRNQWAWNSHSCRGALRWLGTCSSSWLGT